MKNFTEKDDMIVISSKLTTKQKAETLHVNLKSIYNRKYFLKKKNLLNSLILKSEAQNKKDKINAYYREYWKNNPAKYQEHLKKVAVWRTKNPEKIKASAKLYRERIKKNKK